MDLEKYAEELIGELKKYDNLTEDEIVRFIYLSLGKKINFDYNWILADDFDRKFIYDTSGTYEIVNKKIANGNWLMTCRDISFIVSFICKKAGVNVEVFHPKLYFHDPTPHVYNKVIRKDGSEYYIDLTGDLDKIHMNMRTNYFGYLEDPFRSVFSREQLFEMDYKLGYVKKNKQYTDDYLYTLSNYVSRLDSNYEKIEFILTNPSPFLDLNIGYSERVRYITEIVGYFRFRNFLCKLDGNYNCFDCFYKTDSGIIPNELISFEDNGERIYFVYNSELGYYDKISEDDLIIRFSNGLHIPHKYKYKTDFDYSWLNNLYSKRLNNSKKYIKYED